MDVSFASILAAHQREGDCLVLFWLVQLFGWRSLDELLDRKLVALFGRKGERSCFCF